MSWLDIVLPHLIIIRIPSKNEGRLSIKSFFFERLANSPTSGRTGNAVALRPLRCPYEVTITCRSHGVLPLLCVHTYLDTDIYENIERENILEIWKGLGPLFGPEYCKYGQTPPPYSIYMETGNFY